MSDLVKAQMDKQMMEELFPKTPAWQTALIWIGSLLLILSIGVGIYFLIQQFKDKPFEGVAGGGCENIAIGDPCEGVKYKDADGKEKGLKLKDTCQDEGNPGVIYECTTDGWNYPNCSVDWGSACGNTLGKNNTKSKPGTLCYNTKDRGKLYECTMNNKWEREDGSLPAGVTPPPASSTPTSSSASPPASSPGVIDCIIDGIKLNSPWYRLSSTSTDCYNPDGKCCYPQSDGKCKASFAGYGKDGMKDWVTKCSGGPIVYTETADVGASGTPAPSSTTIDCVVNDIKLNSPWYRLSSTSTDCYNPDGKCCVPQSDGKCKASFAGYDKCGMIDWTSKCSGGPIGYTDTKPPSNCSTNQIYTDEVDLNKNIPWEPSQNCLSGYINSISGKSGQYVDSIGFDCSDGTSVKPGGGEGGTPFKVDSVNGFKKLQLKHGKVIDNISLYNENSQYIASKGQWGGSQTTDLTCPGNTKLVGLGIKKMYQDSSPLVSGLTFGISHGSVVLGGLKMHCR